MSVRWGHLSLQKCLSTFFSAVVVLTRDIESSLAAVSVPIAAYGLQVEGI